MNLKPASNRLHGLMIIECLIYIAILFGVLTIAFTAFARFQSQSAHLRRNLDDIARALRAGEAWREDVRRAASADLLDSEGVLMLRLRKNETEILYAFQKEQVWRKQLPDGEWKAFLKGVKNSVMEANHGTHVTNWVWNLELASAQKTVRLRPLFSFMAVPAFEPNNEAESTNEEN